MKVVAFTPAKSQEQNTLRKSKDFWNRRVSPFISRFIEYKKFFNGRESAVSKNKLPLQLDDAGLNEFINVTAVFQKEFDSIITQIKTIIATQNAYAEGHGQGKFRPAKAQAYNEIVGMKKEWNLQSKKFLIDLIEFKNLVNGKPNKFINQKTFIHQKFSDIGEKVLSDLQMNAGELFHTAVEIMHMQKDIRKNSSADFEIQKQALFEGMKSNPLSRMLSNLKNMPKTLGGSTEAKLYHFKTSFITAFGKLKSTLANLEKHSLTKDGQEQVEKGKQLVDALSQEIGFLLKRYDRFLEALKIDKDPLFILFDPTPTVKPTPTQNQAPVPTSVPASDTHNPPIQNIDAEISKIKDMENQILDFDTTKLYMENKPTFEGYVIDIRKKIIALLKLVKNKISHKDNGVDIWMEINTADSELINKVKEIEVIYKELCKHVFVKLNPTKHHEFDAEMRQRGHKFLQDLMKSSEFMDYEKNVKTAANLLDSLLINPVKRELNKLKITDMFSQLRNDAHEYLRNFRIQIDTLLSDMEKEDVVDLQILVKITGFGFESKFVVVEKEKDTQDNQFTIQYLTKFLTDFVRTWKYFDNPKPYYKRPDKLFQGF